MMKREIIKSATSHSQTMDIQESMFSDGARTVSTNRIESKLWVITGLFDEVEYVATN